MSEDAKLIKPSRVHFLGCSFLITTFLIATFYSSNDQPKKPLVFPNLKVSAPSKLISKPQIRTLEELPLNPEDVDALSLLDFSGLGNPPEILQANRVLLAKETSSGIDPYCNGFALTDTGIIVTSEHCVDDWLTKRIFVYHHGLLYPVIDVVPDYDHDLAIVRINQKMPGVLNGVSIAPQLDLGENMLAAGYQVNEIDNFEQMSFDPELATYDTDTRLVDTHVWLDDDFGPRKDMLTLDAKFVGGQSGSPVVTIDHTIAGVVSRKGGQVSDARFIEDLVCGLYSSL